MYTIYFMYKGTLFEVREGWTAVPHAGDRVTLFTSADQQEYLVGRTVWSIAQNGPVLVYVYLKKVRPPVQ